MGWCVCCFVFFFFKQKTAYEMRISDWSSDVCSSDLLAGRIAAPALRLERADQPVGELERIVLDVDQGQARHEARNLQHEIGRASCRERVCQYVSISVVAVSLKKKTYERSNVSNKQES